MVFDAGRLAAASAPLPMLVASVRQIRGITPKQKPPIITISGDSTWKVITRKFMAHSP